MLDFCTTSGNLLLMSNGGSANRRPTPKPNRLSGSGLLVPLVPSQMFASLDRFGMHSSAAPLLELRNLPRESPRSGPIYRRDMNVKGPMSVFGYDYFAERYKQPLKLMDDARYEALNFADGVRTTSEIRDALFAIYGPIPLEDVEQYLAAAESIGVVNRVSGGSQ